MHHGTTDIVIFSFSLSPLSFTEKLHFGSDSGPVQLRSQAKTSVSPSSQFTNCTSNNMVSKKKSECLGL